ncbi:MAG TPA: hypothetical protein VFF06_36660 [Polyangia bacterium]|nr:hypothetical protein [Polyangia bacterium]
MSTNKLLLALAAIVSLAGCIDWSLDERPLPDMLDCTYSGAAARYPDVCGLDGAPLADGGAANGD